MTIAVADVPPWREVRAHLRKVRKERAGKSVVARASDLYEVLLYVGIGGGVLVTALLRVVGGLTPPSAGAQYWLALATVLLGLALLLRAAPALGPVTVGPAAATWLLTAPMDRRGFLAPRYGTVVLAGTVGGGVVGGAVLAVDAGRGPVGGVGVAVLGAALGALITAAAVRGQARPRWQAALRATAGALAVPAVVGVAVVVLLERAGVALPVPSGPTGALPASAGLAVAVTAALVLVAAAAVVTARADLARLDRRAVTAAGPLLAAMSAGVGWMDASMVLRAAEERRLRAIGTVRSRRLRGGRIRALLTADARRMRRARPAWTGALALLVVPYLASVVVPAAVVPVVQLAGATMAAGGLAGGLRAVAESRGLRRSLGGGDVELIALHCVGPAVVAVVWTVLVAAAGGSLLSLVLVPASAVAVVVRFATRPPRTYGGAVFDVGIGTVPVAMVAELSRGPLLFAVLAGVQLLTG
jgi:hypothetical protein